MLKITQLNITTVLIAPPAVITGDIYWNNVGLLLKGDGTSGGNNNTFIDSSVNNLTLVRGGSMTQGSVSPFASSGGSIYQPDVSVDTLSFTSGAGTNFQYAGDFTVEAWVKSSGGAGRSLFITDAGSGTYFALNIDITAQKIQFYVNSGAPTEFSTALSANTWYHLAIVRIGSGANNVKIYKNGVNVGSLTNTGTLGHANPTLARVGGGVGGVSQYVSNLRVVKGTGVYTGAFTPSTSPLTAISGTVLLIKGENGQIVDSKRESVLTSIGNAQISTTVKKYDAGSISLDGSGDYVSVLGGPVITSQDFTIEMWCNLSSTMEEAPVGRWQQAGVAGVNGWLFYIAGGTPTFLGSTDGTTGGINMSGGTASTGVWDHYAITRSGSTFRLFKNGTQIATTTNASALYNPPTTIKIGRYSGGDLGEYSGYIDDLRITVGVARYTSNFTAPTSLPTS